MTHYFGVEGQDSGYGEGQSTVFAGSVADPLPDNRSH